MTAARDGAGVPGDGGVPGDAGVPDEAGVPGDAGVPDEVYAAALLTLPQLWPARLGALLGQRRAAEGRATGGAATLALEPPAAVGPQRSARVVWDDVVRGRAGADGSLRHLVPIPALPSLAAAWVGAAAHIDVAAVAQQYRRRSVDITLLGNADYPSELAADVAAPHVLFRLGAAMGLDGLRVAIVGTRRCSPIGLEVAWEFATALAAAGWRVVSGLALGIDGAAHHAALEAAGAAPIGVVAGGFDRPYPARHATLWSKVAATGVLLSEWPLGTRSEGWRFPARNRIIAAVSDAVLVIESQDSGGSLITAAEALRRGVPVLAVPGSVRNPAAAGTNALIRDGATPVCTVDEVFAALALEVPTFGRAVAEAAPLADAGRRDTLERRPEPSGTAGAVLTALGWDPTDLNVLLRRVGLDPGTVAYELTRLEADGWVAQDRGRWRRCA